MRGISSTTLAAAAIFLVPAAHPLLIPVVGVPSHLLWWVHVLPVALLTFRHGRVAGAAAVAASAGLVAAGERLFGAGYGTPAEPSTAAALAVALSATNLLVAGFALHARRVGHRHRLLLDLVPAAVLFVDRGGVVRRANPAAGALLGGPSVLAGRRLEDVVRFPDGLAPRRIHDEGGSAGWIEAIDSGGGMRRLHAFVAAAPVPDAGGWQLLLADRSMERAQEEELQRQARLAALGEALAGVAHELNNPLGAILAHAQLGQVERGGGATRELFDTIVAEARRMRELVGELLGFSRTREDEDGVELGALLERLVRIERVTLGRRVVVNLDVAWAGRVRGSATKIEQIVLNLLSNAADAVGKGRGGRILVRARGAGSEVLVEVRDDGPGIDPRVRDTLFHPFVTTKGEGTGLGLAISRRLARSWGGDVEARDDPAGGAVFTLRLPLGGRHGAAARDAGRGDGARRARNAS